MSSTISVVWFRRDLRLHDHAALYHALTSSKAVLPLFIFDTEILYKLEDKNDLRVSFIYQAIAKLKTNLENLGSSLLIKQGSPIEVWQQLLQEYQIENVYTNHDYEPYAIERDNNIKQLLQQKGIHFYTYKDQCIFEKDEILNMAGLPYTVYTPYSKQWKLKCTPQTLASYDTTKHFDSFYQTAPLPLLSLSEIGFNEVNNVFVPPIINTAIVQQYHQTRDIPAIRGTSRLSVHLRFGTISIRELAANATTLNETYLNELIWREFYMQILWHFPHVGQGAAFKPVYDKIKWRNNELEFEKWCEGKTGYPIVDAGMRELNTTGFMHNRVRMITASFLIKHLLIDWRWGEAYFAKKLLDFDLAANNGGWQWVAGSGTDAAPYFRVFNPSAQAIKFDPHLTYIRKWIPEFDTLEYPLPIVEHNFARQRCLKTYQDALQGVK